MKKRKIIKPFPAGITLLPEVSKLMNSCRGNDQDCRIVVREEKASEDEIKKVENVEDKMRMTIVVDKQGHKIRTYYG